MNKAFYRLPVTQYCVRYRLRAQDTGLKEFDVVVDRARDMCLCGKVQYDIALSYDIVYEFYVADVPVPKFEPRTFVDIIGNIANVARVGKYVQHMKTGLWISLP